MHPYSDKVITKQFIAALMERIVREYRTYELVFDCDHRMEAPFSEGKIISWNIHQQLR